MIDFHAHPESYKHWKLSFDGPVARLEMAVDPNYPFAEGYELKLNSYDLAVDIELQDAIRRIRFEHPEVNSVVITSTTDRVFCAGANIPMLAASPHPFKVNFCKFTNETRISIEDASRNSGIKFLAACNGATAGGGYELAIACDEIALVNDNSSTVSLPEVSLLAVLPGTGGLTRLVDKRKIRRDVADVFSTLAEGVRGKKAQKWNLIDETWPKSKFADKVAERALEISEGLPVRGEHGMAWNPVPMEEGENTWTYRYVKVDLDREHRRATLTLCGPDSPQPATAEEYHEQGDEAWVLSCFKELDDALLHLRFEEPLINLVALETRGDMDAILEVEKSLLAHQDDWLVQEILSFVASVLRRYELTAKSFFALVDRDSAFAGLFFELALAGDRIYHIDDPDHPVQIAIGPLSDGHLPMSNGLSRLESRFLADPDHAHGLAKEQPRLDGVEAQEQGLVTFLVEDLDWDDDVRIAMEERASLSPDALTGMEASLRFGGAETCDSKIFGRLSAWQNWIFTRPNATGEEGALPRYGQPEAPRFDWRRT